MKQGGWFGRSRQWAGSAAAGVLLVASATASAAPPGLKGGAAYWVAGDRLIAFVASPRNHPAQERLWLMRADGTGRRPIALRNDGWQEPSLSPSGRRVAVAARLRATPPTLRLLLKAPAGTLIRTLRWRGGVEAVTSAPAWAPDEHAVAFGIDDGKARIVLSDLHKRIGSVSRGRSSQDYAPNWSPDGRRIAFITCGEFRCRLALMRRDGSHRKLIIRNVNGITSLEQPVWAPDGRAIAVPIQFGRRYPGNKNESRRRYGIYVVRPDGSRLRRVAATPPTFTGFVSAAWSPDSRRLAFTDVRELRTVAVTSRRVRRLTAMGGISSIAWAPSARILFTRPGPGEIYTVLPGRRPVRILG